MAKKKTSDKTQRQWTRRQLSQYKKQQRRQRFIFIGGISVIVIVALLILVGWLTGEYLPLKETVIKVGEEKYDLQYYIDYVDYYVDLYSGSIGPDNIMTLASSAITQIQNNALVIMDAEKKGVTVEDEEAREALEEREMEINEASIDITKAQMLGQQMKDDYFAEDVPESASQVNARVMLLESESRAADIREMLLAGDNFSTLAGEFSLHASTNGTGGEVGWHPEEIMEDKVGSSVPVEFAFDAEAGDLSRPLEDEDARKRVGYWLINVQEITDEGATLKLVLLGSREEAEDIRTRLGTTDNVTALIEEYSQHAASSGRGGEMGPVSEGEMSQAVDAYVFDEDVETGVWSRPVRDDTVSTTGGYWLVEVIDKENDMEISGDDRESLINNAYSEWANGLIDIYKDSIDISNLTSDKIQWAVKKIREDLE